MKCSRLTTKAAVCLASVAFSLALAEAKEKKVPIGATPEKFTLKDIRYLPRTLDDFGQPKAFVIVFTTTGCPLVQRYLPRLKELSAQYQDQGVQFVAINVGPDDSIKEVAYQAVEHGVDFPFVKDFDGDCARALAQPHTGSRRARCRAQDSLSRTH
jgi:thiol-disulfide isomerase/thioredoxin